MSRAREQLLIGVMGDEDTVTGFLLAGIGERSRKGQRNFLVVNSETTLKEIEQSFREMTERTDIGILLICQHVAEEIRHLVSSYDKAQPTLLEIPSKSQEYDAEKDSVMLRCKRLLGLA